MAGRLGDETSLDRILEALKRNKSAACGSARLATWRDQQLIRVAAYADQTTLSGASSASARATLGAWESRHDDKQVSFARVAVARCGQIENMRALKRRLIAAGITRDEASEEETLADLICLFLDRGATAEEAFAKSLDHIRGAFALLALISWEGGPRLLGAQRGQALHAALDGSGVTIASTTLALDQGATRHVTLQPGDLALIDASGLTLVDALGMRLVRPLSLPRSMAPRHEASASEAVF